MIDKKLITQMRLGLLTAFAIVATGCSSQVSIAPAHADLGSEYNKLTKSQYSEAISRQKKCRENILNAKSFYRFRDERTQDIGTYREGARVYDVSLIAVLPGNRLSFITTKLYDLNYNDRSGPSFFVCYSSDDREGISSIVLGKTYKVPRRDIDKKFEYTENEEKTTILEYVSEDGIIYTPAVYNRLKDLESERILKDSRLQYCKMGDSRTFNQIPDDYCRMIE